MFSKELREMLEMLNDITRKDVLTAFVIVAGLYSTLVIMSKCFMLMS
jgi:hypothetical protein